MKKKLEEAAEQFEQMYIKGNTVLTDAEKFIAGAQWQKEQEANQRLEEAAMHIAQGMVVGRGVDLDRGDQETIAMVSCQIAAKIFRRIEDNLDNLTF